MCSSHHGSARMSSTHAFGDVPVVDHVVVVEDHRRGHDRQQPAFDLWRPRLAIQHRVLLEVCDQIRRRLRVVVGVIVAIGVDAQLRQRRRIVGVHLVAEQHHEVGPLLDRLAEHAQPVSAQRIDADPSLVVGGFEIEGRLVRRRGTATSEQHADRLVAAERADRAGRKRAAGLRPPLHPVEMHRVRDTRAGVEAA